MSFVDITLFMMNMVNNTMQREINDFIKNIKKSKMNYSKSAMSKARKKITPQLFKDLNNGFIEDIYEDVNDVKLFKGMRLLGVDGTILELPNNAIAKDIQQSEDLKIIYGQKSTHIDKYATISKVSILYDVENNIVIDGILNSISSSEPFMAIEHIDYISEQRKNSKILYNDLLIYDRGYPSFGLISYHYKHNLDFLMRVNTKSFRAVQAFRDSNSTDEILDIKVSYGILANLSDHKQHSNLKKLKEGLKLGDIIKVRAIKVILDNGDIEVLLTSLLSQESYKTEIFKELYFKRWGVEKAYDILKNIFNIENFTGLTQLAINQDFFAIILTNNITFLIMSGVMDEKVTLYNSKKKRKYLYQLNRNFSIGCMKDKVIYMLMKNTKITKLYDLIESEIIKNLLPIKPNRNFPRVNRYNIKFPTSKKNGF